MLALPRVMDPEWVRSAVGSLESLSGEDGSWKGIPHLARNTMGEGQALGVRMEVLEDAALADPDTSPALLGTPRLRLRGTASEHSRFVLSST